MAENTTIARPYAQAIFALARQQDDLSGWSVMLELASSVVSDADMATMIDSPHISSGQLADIILDVCGDGLNDSGKNMVRVLADNHRLALLPQVAALYEIDRAHAEGTLEAEVVSAIMLTDTQKAGLCAALQRRLGREVSLNCSIDTSLLGGAIIRAGDMVIDGSAISTLNKLASALLH